MKNKKVRMFTKIALSITLMALSANSVFAISGLEVMNKVYNRKSPKTLKGILSMILINSSKEKRTRLIKQYINDNGAVEKKIMFFLKPADVRDTSFMNFSYNSAKSDDQWIYLPALKRVKRISSDSKGDYFMGSDFTYDDLGDRNPRSDNHTVLREETYKGQPCYVIQSTPKDSEYMYSKTITWVVKGKWIGLKKLFYDEDGDFLKTLIVNKYQNVGGYDIILSTSMLNAQNKHSTVMVLSGIQVNKSVPASYFSERRMRRGIK